MRSAAGQLSVRSRPAGLDRGLDTQRVAGCGLGEEKHVARWMINGSLRSRGLVVAVGLGLLLYGVLQLRDLPRDALPEFTPPTVEVQTEALGLSANEVEQLVTVPLEQDLLNGVAYLDTITSESVAGLSTIQLVFEKGTPLTKARQVVNERLTQAFALPNVSTPPQMIQPRSSTSRVMMIRISSKERSLLDLGLLARWTVRPQLMGIDGVANVSVWGQREQQLQVLVDPATLQAQGVTLDEVIQTTGNALWVSPLTFLPSSTPGAGGFFDTSTQRIGVEHAQPITSPDALANVVLEREDGSASAGPGGRRRLGDVTKVVEDHQPLIGDAVFTDGDGGLLVVVEKLPGTNSVEVTKRVEAALAKLEPGLPGVNVDSTFFRPADYVEDSIGGLGRSLLLGAIVAALLLVALLFRARNAVVTIVSSVVTAGAAVGVLALRGETLNAMALAGLVLALAVVIDDAATSADAAARSLDGGEEDRPAAFRRYAAAVLSSRRPLAYATAVSLVALVPLLVLTGESGALIPPVLLSYAAAVVVSMIVAMTFTPALTMLIRAGVPRAEWRSPVAAALQRGHDRASARLAGRGLVPALAVLGVIAVLGLGSLALVDRGPSVVPAFVDSDLVVSIETPEGTSLPETKRIAARMAAELEGLDAVEQVAGHVGRAILGDQTVNVNAGQLWLHLDDAAAYAGARRAVAEVVHGYAGVDATIQTYEQARIESILDRPDGVPGKDLTVRVFGYDHGELARQAERVRDAVSRVNGITAAEVRLPSRQPTIEIEVDLPKAQAAGVKPGDVRRAAATMISGITVGNLFEDQKVFDVVVMGEPSTHDNITRVRELLINPPGGGAPVRLDSVADVRVVMSPALIRHEAVSRSVDVGFDVKGRSVGAAAKDVEKAVLGLAYPVEYHAELLPGHSTGRSNTFRTLAAASAALVGIVLLVQAATGSWRMALMVMVLLAGALAGGMVGAAIHGGTVTIGIVVGFLAVLAISVRQSLAYVQRCHEVEDEGVIAGDQVASIVAAERFVPTVATAALTLGMLTPLLFFGGGAGHEIARPLAAVVIGGVVASAVLSVGALPALYAAFGARSAESRERIELFRDPTAADPWQMAEL